jgi:hypothetical protein
MTLCISCGRPFQGLCIPCEEAKLAQTVHDKQNPMFFCLVCGAKSSQAWIDELCERCVETPEGKAVKDA